MKKLERMSEVSQMCSEAKKNRKRMSVVSSVA
ncbi:hypothetical protein SIFV0001 [Sulfolobus islandicus filamentous virus]|uniref:Uncharacterized protein 1 n=1 Tax=Sulfolobus islandicus filamentous virus (isolate Iceland/Hveragerdi) TaxID=654908 RepID=Y001_SIFVH|nr:hypothetical protein SIFV0001 [Sulfolobus islandicus filamentous virus]Q914M9.1 RecName: Full=Uncharacterized protein 1 [Sulfolobus islandicus filamentous virus (isolate Hveragerdi)]AAL27712.1 hypothetical protein [Sulfolobus islandicus filamentous virus]